MIYIVITVIFRLLYLYICFYSCLPSNQYSFSLAITLIFFFRYYEQFKMTLLLNFFVLAFVTTLLLIEEVSHDKTEEDEKVTADVCGIDREIYHQHPHLNKNGE